MVAVASTIVGERLCERVDVRAGQRVLDVATGSGNTALAAARGRYCDVTTVDFVPALVERGRERARCFNRSGDETMAVPAEYPEIVALRR